MNGVPTGLDALPVIGAAMLRTVLLASEALVIPAALLLATIVIVRAARVIRGGHDAR